MTDDKVNLKYNSMPKKMFIFLVFFGCCFIWIAKIFSVPQLIITPLVVALVPLYCFLSLRNKEFFIKEDQVGDNAYYMGFLFTLASLSHALFSFNGSNDREIDHIVGNFGIALWSTIAGIACRVYVAQLRQDIDEVEENVKINLLETSNRLTNELGQISFNLNNCTRALQNSIEESYQFANEKIQNNLIKISDNFANKISENIDKSNLIFEQFEANCEDINSHSKAVIKTFAKLVSNIENTEMPTDIFNKKINEIFNEVENNFNKSNKIIIAQNLINEETIKQTQLLNNNYEKLSDNIRNNNQEFTELKNDNKEFISSINSLNKNLRNFVEVNQKQLESLTKNNDVNQKQLESLTKNNEKLVQSIEILILKIEESDKARQLQIAEQNSSSKDGFFKKFIN
jgi:molecular chaperone GrpE (heat shock protein)